MLATHIRFPIDLLQVMLQLLMWSGNVCTQRFHHYSYPVISCPSTTANTTLHMQDLLHHLEKKSSLQGVLNLSGASGGNSSCARTPGLINVE